MDITNDTNKPQRKRFVSVYIWYIVIGILVTIPLTVGVEFLNNTYIVKPDPPIPFWPDLWVRNLSSGVIGFIVGMLAGTAKVLHDTLNDLRVEQSTLKTQVFKIIKDTLPTILSEHVINITGVHRGKPAGAALIANAGLFCGEDSDGNSKDYLDGLLIMEHHAFTNQYASHCKKVIAHNGIRNIYSMSDFGLDLTFHMFCQAMRDYNEDVIEWIDIVNNTKKVKIKRIQVLTQWRYQFLEKLICYKQDNNKWKGLIDYVRPSIKKQYENEENVSLINDESNAKLLANNLVNGYEWYCENYAFVDLDKALGNGEIIKRNDHINWAVYTRESIKHAPGKDISNVTPGEFIIFNEDVLVRYSERYNQKLCLRN